ncbi:MAG: mechanosensitive ion channel family protein [Armatimonadota bacterium]
MNNLSILNIEQWSRFWRNHADIVLLSLTKIVVIVAVYVAARFVLFKLISRMLDIPAVKRGGSLLGARKARLRALQSVLRSVVGTLLGFIALVMILAAIGFNIVPVLSSVLATAGVVGLAIGFGAQKLVRDTISGFFILMEDQYGVGDYVTIGTTSGVVDELGVRTTRIRDNMGRLCIISNGDITQVINHSRGKLRLSIEINLPAAADLDKVAQVVNEVGQSLATDMPKKIKEPFAYNGLVQIGGETVTARISGGVFAIDQNEVQMELNKRLKEAFDRESIQLG